MFIIHFMVENIKEKIAQVSRELFNANGYQKVSMRQIAEHCGISVGNLTYHYPHKEDLLMLEHDSILNDFLGAVLSGDSGLSGLKGYFTVECAFLFRILNDPPVAALYADVINVPSLRLRYCRAHYELYCRFMGTPQDEKRAWEATAAMSALEYALSSLYTPESFPAYMERVFQSRILFDGGETASASGLIRDAVSQGMALAQSFSGKLCP